MQELITIKNLTYKNILKNISLSIPARSMIAISGTNKCGKTTLMKLLSGILDGQEAIIFENGYLNSFTKTEVYQKIGFIIPSMDLSFLFPTVEQELLFVLNNLGMDQESQKNRYKAILSIFKLKNQTQKDPKHLDLFLKIKLSLALAVIHKPKIIFLDDICSMLTKKETTEILTILKKLNEEENLTIVMTTNNLEETLNFHELYILHNGEIVLEGSPLKVLQEDSTLNKMGLSLPFMVDLSLKLKYYDLIDYIELDMDRLVNALWK